TKENTKILCERTLYTPDAIPFSGIIPVSVDTIEKAIVLAVK
ncbi:M protein trans-acting positive regulator, partial [Listeria monocytogenes]|nr:M protein trans-acting positive regulator [Listeria monocytogenes]